MVYGPSNGNKTFDPNTPYFGNHTTTQMVLLSPLFQTYVDFVQGGMDLGKTQYIDAYQRGNFWRNVQTNTNYHVVLKTVLGPTDIQRFATADGKVISNPWSGIPTGTVDINWFDRAVADRHRTSSAQITAQHLPVVPHRQRLPDLGWLLHRRLSQRQWGSAEWPDLPCQPRSSTSWRPVFSQDIAALSHEVGEWMDGSVQKQLVALPGQRHSGSRRSTGCTTIHTP